MLTQYFKQVSAPISKSKPVGERLDDDTLFDFVENQLMKIGSLSHGDIQWEKVESAILTLLETRSKDLKLMAYLMQCLQYQASIERFSLSLLLLNEFMSQYWETCFPAPGKRGVLPRRKFFSQIVQRSVKAGGNLNTQFCDPESKELLLSELANLLATARNFELPYDGLEQLNCSLVTKFKQAEQQVPNEGQEDDIREQQYLSSRTKLDVDSSDDKATRQTLLKVADFIAEFDGETGLSFRIRRFATWFAVSNAPENANADGETTLMPIAADRISEYQSQLVKGADLALLRRVEQSLTLSPFWIDGHHLSARIAMALGQPIWAEAIHKESAAFVAKLPDLLTMSFRGGLPFVNPETRHWLNEGYGKRGQNGGGEQCEDISAVADTLGLSAAFTMLNEHLESASEPRETFYLRLQNADLKHNHQLTAMANIEYQILYEQAQNMALADWEPGLMSRLKQKSNLR